MGKWLDQLKQKTQNDAYHPVTNVPEVCCVTSVTPSQGPFPLFRLIESLDDLTPLEHKAVMWLFNRGMVYPHQLAAYLKIPMDKLESVLANLDTNRLILWCDGYIALNVYGKQKLGLIPQWAPPGCR